MSSLNPLLSAACLVLAVAGCASSTPKVDARFGASRDAIHAAQVIHPDPAPGATAGLDGTAAAGAMERYRASFRNPPEPVNVFNIGVGGASSR